MRNAVPTRSVDQVHPDPDTNPYLAARSWRVNASMRRQRLLQVLAVLSLVLALALVACVALLVVSRDRQDITPYLVRVNDDGAVLGVDPLTEPATPNRAMVQHALRLFVLNSRTVTTDRAAQRRRILRAYAYATGRATAVLNSFYRDTPPFARAERASVTPVLESFLRLSDRDVYQVEWSEEVRNLNGAIVETQHSRALLTVTVQPPQSINDALVNPLGIKVSDLDWTRTTETTGASRCTPPPHPRASSARHAVHRRSTGDPRSGPAGLCR